MSNDIKNTLNEANKPVVEVAREFNKLTVNSLEKAVNLQLASIKSYADLILANLKAGIEVADVKAAQDYVGRQGEVAKTVYEKLVKDGKALAEIREQFNADVVKLVRKHLDAPVKSAPVKKAA